MYYKLCELVEDGSEIERFTKEIMEPNASPYVNEILKVLVEYKFDPELVEQFCDAHIPIGTNLIFERPVLLKAAMAGILCMEDIGRYPSLIDRFIQLSLDGVTTILWGRLRDFIKEKYEVEHLNSPLTTFKALLTYNLMTEDGVKHYLNRHRVDISFEDYEVYLMKLYETENSTDKEKEVYADVIEREYTKKVLLEGK